MINDRTIEDLFNTAQEATKRIFRLTEDLSFAREYEGVPRPFPSWWWRFVPSKRREVRVWHFAEQVRAEAPLQLEMAVIDLTRAVKKLKERRYQYSFAETPSGDFRAWLTSMSSGQVIARSAT